MHFVLPFEKTMYPGWLSSAVLWLGACNRFQSRVLHELFVATLLVIVPSSLGLVRSVTLCSLMIFVIKNFLSQLLSPLLLSECF
jgi:hypothetical protein